MYPNFFSEFPDYSTVSHRFKNVLARNINCYNTYSIDQKLVEYLYRINCADGSRLPFDTIKLAESLNVKVSFDDFGPTAKTFGHLKRPKSMLNPSDSFIASVNKRLKKRERVFTAGHETAHRLIEYDKNGKYQAIWSLLYFEREAEEKTCDKIAREIVIPSPSIRREIHRVSSDGISLKTAKKLSGVYEVPLSQMLFKLTDDLNLWDVILFSQKDEKTYGNKRILLSDKNQFPVCEFNCHECKKKKYELEEKAISKVLRKIKDNEKIKGIIREDWKEKPLPIVERSYWIAYRIGSEQTTLV